MEVDTPGTSTLMTMQTRFSREFTNLYLKIAESARKQNNYAVATRYLKLTEKAAREVCGVDLLKIE